MELKENAVQCYLTTDLTYEAVARKFEITNFTLLASWVNHFKIYGEVPISKREDGVKTRKHCIVYDSEPK